MLFHVISLITWTVLIIIRIRPFKRIWLTVLVGGLLTYLIALPFGTYPEGFWALFRPPGLWDTLWDSLIILLDGVLVCLVLLLIAWISGKTRVLYNRLVAWIRPFKPSRSEDGNAS